MNTILIHPFGNPNAYNAAEALYETGRLAAFHTCLFNPCNSKLRYHEALKAAPISIHPAFESIRLLMTRLPTVNHFARSQRIIDRVGLNCDLQSSRSIQKGTDAVYGYEDFAMHSFERAAELGAERIYELPIGFYSSHRTFLEQETQGEPEIRPYIQALNEPEDKIRRKEREISLATHIICASSFTASTVPASTSRSAPVSVIPYGVDCSGRAKLWDKTDNQGPLKLIFVGKLDPRKGLHILFQALHCIPKESYELTLAGRWVPGFKHFLDKKFSASYTEIGQVPQRELHEIYKKHHVLVFPSLFEGFGLVILEAMAAGIPVIATERTAGPDIFTNESGFIVQAGSPDALLQCIQRMLNSRDQLSARGAESRKIAESLSWERYRARLIKDLARSSAVAH